jgi:hypothetical protein
MLERTLSVLDQATLEDAAATTVVRLTASELAHFTGDAVVSDAHMLIAYVQSAGRAGQVSNASRVQLDPMLDDAERAADEADDSTLPLIQERMANDPSSELLRLQATTSAAAWTRCLSNAI